MISSLINLTAINVEGRVFLDPEKYQIATTYSGLGLPPGTLKLLAIGNQIKRIIEQRNGEDDSLLEKLSLQELVFFSLFNFKEEVVKIELLTLVEEDSLEMNRLLTTCAKIREFLPSTHRFSQVKDFDS